MRLANIMSIVFFHIAKIYLVIDIEVVLTYAFKRLHFESVFPIELIQMSRFQTIKNVGGKQLSK